MAPGEFAESTGEYGASSPAVVGRDPAALVRALARRERALWGLVALATLADVVTTVVGIRLGLAEGNPLISGVLASAGVGGFLAIKAAVLAAALGLRVCFPRFRVAVPLGLALPWLFAAGVNAVLISAMA